MSVELHLPDLPEVPISLGPVRGAGPRADTPWHLRLRHALSSYLPLLLMALLALATWWLAKHSPRPPAPPAERGASADPDYTMTQFALERFDAGGRLKLRIEGARMRHFPASDRIEIEGVQIHAYAPDGRSTLASARYAVGTGDGSEMQLSGGAQLIGSSAQGVDVVLRSEFLHLYLAAERVHGPVPVLVHQGASTMQAEGLDYDHGRRLLELKGPLRTVLAPPRGAAP
ncbi:LPS export ABC transporter periplasmic protein LptC [Rubrivivax sp. A210]|uniref:LPS export ABC transporter periplasmic protein LptC n=1 Tax=Rubrivivax sp. A210 TaxID=2772301 RepID=UPI001919EC4D|nr:LPS export ABC transporter periplasmic protein LptC [Rubrivivax sp. A210]CAD5373417.1 LPS export ABC transporter periplasmic protein LptC [Rubrivivax sp. A210]